MSGGVWVARGGARWDSVGHACTGSAVPLGRVRVGVVPLGRVRVGVVPLLWARSTPNVCSHELQTTSLVTDQGPSSEWRMKSLLTSSLLFISIQFNDIVNDQSLVRRVTESQCCHIDTSLVTDQSLSVVMLTHREVTDQSLSVNHVDTP